MARGVGTYSRVIAWLKILLPLAALALLSTLFLLSRSTESALDVPFADALSGEQTASEQVSAPYYAGTTANGDVLTMSARSARPAEDGVIRADGLEARLALSDGSRLLMNANLATLRDTAKDAHLEGGVRIESSVGYVIETEALVSGLDRIEAESLGPVTASGPAGTLEAGKLRVAPIGDQGDVQLLFTEGVKLVYDPKH